MRDIQHLFEVKNANEYFQYFDDKIDSDDFDYNKKRSKKQHRLIEKIISLEIAISFIFYNLGRFDGMVLDNLKELRSKLIQKYGRKYDEDYISLNKYY